MNDQCIFTLALLAEGKFTDDCLTTFRQMLARNGAQPTSAGRILLKDSGFGRTKSPCGGGDGVELRAN